MAVGEQDIPRDYHRVEEFASELRTETPTRIIEWALERYAPRLAVVSNFGPSTVTVIHHLAELGKADVPVLHIDTGFEFPETEEVGARLTERYGIQIQNIHPELTVTQQAEKYGDELYKSDSDYCCYMRKVLPLEKVLSEYDAWVTGIRKSQASTRRAAQVVEWDVRHDMIKVNPLAEWDSDDVWACIRENDIPYNTLHDNGYPSIGCWPCTRSVAEGGDERSGRWSGLNKAECGIHLTHFATPQPTEKGR
ncbi:phosphoadenylyl-sulfate reductase [Candidatus Poribacteria bacterium]|jgi:phosphoadenosine phosphosulfate reductase|nr:phosphoadenylyl-sulfate reductase [Candidatus Poribacteria bacterium]MBT5533932.1 phosphoadenylyl-sulfate reductase [Candidatus Poribacteria bacterium]MBT5714374.1 phosphoadenylyl-sulfate reductase [Candidatus Poribacteria bacterium]MBT7097555.1 phosphoadenylyl-sulfate reductase [Candidatus Poribacteria bacterium]MBT7804882.1 phosphoadenylyl-sulfate reductase [Candidatus Poribacteria bacterium]